MARGDDHLGQAELPRRIGLVVDHPLRDLDGLCLVAQLLCERGHEAVLLPFYTQHFDLPNIELDLIVLNYARPANRALVEAASARGIALAVLDTEGGLLPEKGPTSSSGIATYLQQSGLDKELALYLFWGEQLRDAVVSQTALPPERAIITGCPRFDLARSPTITSGEERPRRVLVNTNFPIVNSALAEGTDIDDKALRSVGFNQAEIADLAQNVRTVMHRMIETLRTLAQARPDRQFVIRPHPFERAAPYEAAFADFPNVTTERVGTAMEALAQSACLLHVNCTTAIEACLTGVPPISLDFINEPGLQAMARLPSQISHNARSQAEALALIDRAGELDPGLERERITPFFGPLDGRAAIRVADALATLPIPAPLAAARPRNVRRMRPSSRLSALLGRTIGSGAIEGARRMMGPLRKLKAFGLTEVRWQIERFAEAHGRPPARIERCRSALGLPTLALRLTPAKETSGDASSDKEALAPR